MGRWRACAARAILLFCAYGPRSRGDDGDVDVLSALGINATATNSALREGAVRLGALHVTKHLERHRREAPGRFARAREALEAFSQCLERPAVSDCIMQIYPCLEVFKQQSRRADFSSHAFACPKILTPDSLTLAQRRVVAADVLGSRTFFEWGGGGSTELIAPLALRSYSVEHYAPWCNCLQTRPLSRCLQERRTPVHPNDDHSSSVGHAERIMCIHTNLNLRSYGRLAPDGANKKNIVKAYADPLDAAGVFFSAS